MEQQAAVVEKDNTPPSTADRLSGTEPKTDDKAVEAVVPAKAEDDGYQGPVDLSNLPDDIRKPIEARLSVLTKKMGNQERRYKGELSEYREIAEKQSKIIEELQSGVGQVVDHLQDKSLDAAESAIMQRLETAHESDDTKGFLAAQKDLARLEAKKIQAEERRSAQKNAKPAATTEKIPNNAGNAAREAAADGEFDSENAVVVEAWQAETDQSGNLLRPWAHSKTPDNPTNDPYYRRALIESAAVFDEASPWASKPIAEKLAEVDRRMGIQKTNGTQAVMGGGLTNNRKSAKVSLTSNQERIAVRTKFGGSKAKSDADHIAAFRAQVDKYNSTKGTRK